jgi:hypothetical protein
MKTMTKTWLNDVETMAITLTLALTACGDSGATTASGTATDGGTSTGSATATATQGSTSTSESATATTVGSDSLSDSQASMTAPTGSDSLSDSATVSATDSASATDSTTGTTGAMTGTGDTGTSTGGTTVGVDTGSTGGGSTTGAVNLPPEITSEAVLELVIQKQLGGKFMPGQIFLASSVTKQIRVYDAQTLKFLQSFTHPLFAETNYNPRGMAFNERGNLVVATFTTFIEFSDYGVVYKTYPKKAPEATENVIFDSLGNLYTTTATGGSDQLNQYAVKDYVYAQTIKGPPGAGQFTGITFDDQRRLYLASQGDNKIHVAEADADFSNFVWIKSLPGQGPAVRLEGLVFNITGELVVAQADLLRYDLVQGKVVGTFDVPQDAWPVPISVDNSGNIYTSDFEDGGGVGSADIIRFDAEGKNPLVINDPALFGPFGLAISGVVLASDPPVLYSYQVTATDPDGDPLTFKLLLAPPEMTIDPQTGLIEWLVTSKQIGLHDVTVEVSDGQGNTDIQMYVLQISGA